jgi:hypothetical protein
VLVDTLAPPRVAAVVRRACFHRGVGPLWLRFAYAPSVLVMKYLGGETAGQVRRALVGLGVLDEEGEGEGEGEEGEGGGRRGRRRRRRRRRQLPRGVAAVAEHTEAAHDAASSSIVIGLARSAWRGKLWRRRCCAGCGCLVAAVDVAAVEDSAAARHGDVCARRTDGGAVQ